MCLTSKAQLQIPLTWKCCRKQLVLHYFLFGNFPRLGEIKILYRHYKDIIYKDIIRLKQSELTDHKQLTIFHRIANFCAEFCTEENLHNV